MTAIDTSPRGPGPILARLLDAELHAIPVAKWGHMFPAHVAVWKLIENQVPGVLGPLTAVFDSEPTFEGAGADWFVTELVGRSEYLDLVDVVMRSIAAQLSPEAIERGFVREPIVLLTPEVEALAYLAIATARAASVDGSDPF